VGHVVSGESALVLQSCPFIESFGSPGTRKCSVCLALCCSLVHLHNLLLQAVVTLLS